MPTLAGGTIGWCWVFATGVGLIFIVCLYDGAHHDAKPMPKKADQRDVEFMMENNADRHLLPRHYSDWLADTISFEVLLDFFIDCHSGCGIDIAACIAFFELGNTAPI